MNLKDVLALFESQRDPRGMKHWERLGHPEWTAYGIGLTKLKKIVKSIGRNHRLALELWEQPNYECRIAACLIDEPDQVTKTQIRAQLKDAGMWIVTHVYCHDLLSRTKFARELADKWRDEKNDIKRRCAWLLHVDLAGEKPPLDDAYFVEAIERIETSVQTEVNDVKDAMLAALLRIGSMNRRLHKAALASARRIGFVEIDYGDTGCKPLDVAGRLRSATIVKRVSSR